MNLSLALDVLGSWFVPGFGFFRRGRPIRALILFLTIEGTFFLGIFFKGGVTPPVWEINGGGLIISLLTFLIQLGNGLTAFLSLGAVLWSQTLMAKGLLPSPLVQVFSGYQAHALFDLGTFYILVAGAMNYFSVMNFYDRYKTKSPEHLYHSKDEEK